MAQVSRNTTNSSTDEMEWNVLCGIEMYDGYNEVDTCRFAEFKDTTNIQTGCSAAERLASGLTQVPQYADWAIDPRNRVRNLSFNEEGVPKSVARRLYFRDPGLLFNSSVPHESGDNQIAHNIIVDEDDSLGLGAGQKTYVMPYTPFLVENPRGTIPNLDSLTNSYAITDDDDWNYAQVTVKINAGPSLPNGMKVERDFNDGQDPATRNFWARGALLVCRKRQLRLPMKNFR